MPEYAILILPSANRVYTDTSRRLLRAELAVFGDTVLSTKVGESATTTIGGVDYVTFGTAAPLTDNDVAYLSNLSSAYALFEVSGELLRPLTMTPVAEFDSDLLTIQKYPGKTNELFTKLVVNLAVLATDRPAALLGRGLHVLDPLCGRGTTLNQAMMYGFDATGLELDGKDFDAYQHFIKTWLRTKRIKHSAQAGLLRRNRVRLGQRLDIEYGASKERYKAGDTRTVSYFNCDTLHTDELVKKGSVDVIVTDAPYGVQHGSRTQDSALSRSPRDLLAAAVPTWARVLRKGGALAVSWNTYVVKRAELAEILTGAGLTPREEGPYTELAHRVDQAIVRDVLVATK
ncbi:SAM-dependent methyltransferase [Saccharomonospora amisosensis]|uniref:SAM-dependent methyltransferase n=1 Tax=Saccharomonospora amisosensis TaxID=1128677 RepID=A0A7X5ZRH2_9PSEU|nr:SAM-dependent methyltransferase [Saccharomonospora amisosensis]NIJ12848.1 SAM-dependent methyltransferase [Saccharomonospora amisosensis]